MEATTGQTGDRWSGRRRLVARASGARRPVGARRPQLTRSLVKLQQTVDLRLREMVAVPPAAP